MGVIAYGLIYYFIFYKKFNKNYQYSEIASEQTTLNSQNENANWKTYKNDEHGFEIKYPANQIMFLENPESKNDCFVAMNDYNGNCVLLAIETEKNILAGPIQGIRVLLVNHPLDVGVTNRNNYSKDNLELACPQEAMTKFSIGSVLAYKDENKCDTYYLNESTLIPLDSEHFIEFEIKQKWNKEEGGMSVNDWNKIIQSFKFTK